MVGTKSLIQTKSQNVFNVHVMILDAQSKHTEANVVVVIQCACSFVFKKNFFCNKWTPKQLLI